MAKYNPPQQSLFGQVIDAILLMALVFGALWLPVELKLAGAEKVDWLPGNVTTTMAEDGAIILQNDKGLIKKIAPEGGPITFEGLSWEAIEQNPAAQSAWEKLWDKQGVQAITSVLGQDPKSALEGAAMIVTSRYDYDVSALGVLATLAAIFLYFVFILRLSEKEYREVIAEKFGDNKGGAR